MILLIIKIVSILALIYLVYEAGRADDGKCKAESMRYFLLIQTTDEVRLELVQPINDYWAQRAEVLKAFSNYNDRKDIINIDMYRANDVYLERVDIQEYFASHWGSK